MLIWQVEPAICALQLATFPEFQHNFLQSLPRQQSPSLDFVAFLSFFKQALGLPSYGKY